jgi:hypothetical protein
VQFDELERQAAEAEQALGGELEALASATTPAQADEALRALEQRELALERLEADIDRFLDEVEDGSHPELDRDRADEQAQALTDRLLALSERIRNAETPAVFDSSPALEDTDEP